LIKKYQQHMSAGKYWNLYREAGNEKQES